MSKWYEVDKENMDLNDANDELNVFFDTDSDGTNYVSIRVADILMLFKQKGII